MIPDDLHAAEWKQRAERAEAEVLRLNGAGAAIRWQLAADSAAARAEKAEAMVLRLDAALREAGREAVEAMQRAIDATARHAEAMRVAAEKLEAAEDRVAEAEKAEAWARENERDAVDARKRSEEEVLMMRTALAPARCSKHHVHPSKCCNGDYTVWLVWSAGL